MPRSTLSSFSLLLALVAVGAVATQMIEDDVELLAAPSAPTLTAPAPLAAEPLPPVLSEDRTAPGSGELGEWRGTTLRISEPAQFQAVKDADGVLVVGDSIARAAVDELTARLAAAHGLPVAVNVQPGRPTAPAVDWIVENAALIPDRGLVVVAGANDIFAPLGWWRQVERVLAAADGRPVYWLTVHVDRWRGDAAQREADVSNSAWLNDQLRAVAAEHPNLVVVDWAGALTDDWLSDGVHPSEAGVLAWCDLIGTALGLTAS